MKNKSLQYLLFISNLLFVVLYLILVWNNRLAIDDYYFLFKFNEYGIVDAVIHDYNTWSTRWTSNFLTHSVLWIDSVTGKGLFIFGLINISLFTASVYLLFKGLLYLVDRNFKMKFWQGMNCGLFTVSILFIATIRIGETWFWLCASCTYLWSNMMFVLGWAWILYPQKSKIFSLVGFVTFIYVGGGSEPLAIITMFLLIVVLVLAVSGKLKSVQSTHLLFFRLGTAILLCFVSFLVLNLGAGIAKREGFFENIGLLRSGILNIKMTGIIIVKRLPYILPYLLLLGTAGLWVGSHFKSTKSFNWKLSILLISLAYFTLIFIYQFPITYITHDTAAFRALMIVNLFSTVYVVSTFFILGKYSKLNKQTATSIFIVSMFCSVGIFGYYLVQQGPKAFCYAASVDQRMNYLAHIPLVMEVIEVNPLESSGFLYSAELSEDTAYFANKHFRKALYIKPPLRVKRGK